MTDPSPPLPGILGLLASTALAAQMRRDGSRLPTSRAAGTAASYLATGLLVAWDLRTDGGALASVDLIWFAPQLPLAARETSLTGISAAQRTNLALNGSWIVYAVAAGHPAAGVRSAGVCSAGVCSDAACAASGYLLWRLHRTRRAALRYGEGTPDRAGP